jgi:transcriptional regulatory protein GAL4
MEYPPDSSELTLYTSIRAYASFYLAVVPIYARMATRPYPSAEELLALDDTIITPWLASVPACFTESAEIPPKHRLSHSVLQWKYRHFKTLMYRPFVVKGMLQSQQAGSPGSSQGMLAQQRCLNEAQASIAAIEDFWNNNDRTRLAAWYAL